MKSVQSKVKQLLERYNIGEIQNQTKKIGELCPVARVNPDFSPSRIAVLARDDPQSLMKDILIWQCLACGLCKEISGAEMSYFIRDLREIARSEGFTGSTTHGGALLSIQRISSDPAVKPARNGWITEPLKVEPKRGKQLFWVGNAPYFHALMPELGWTAIDSARSAVLLLNRLGIRPVVMEDERSSGHDLLWTGDTEGFLRLAEQNLTAIRNTSARTVIVSSPEDYYTLGRSYLEYFGELDFEVIHITEFIAKQLGRLQFREWRRRVTYHDPCRLGRGMGVYDAPRQLLNAVPGVELLEMKENRRRSLCCGTSCWTDCTRYSKLMQTSRLQEAADLGAEVLITTCWECAIHFRCTNTPQAWRQVHIDIEDLTYLMASLLEE
jgi:heterodisulfide reductase subunit D